MADTPAIPPLAPALGRIPSGLFILTARHGEQSTGMLASWVMQAGFMPPQVTIAIQKNRYIADWVRAGGTFVLNQIPAGNKTLLKQFGKGFKPDEDAFAGVDAHDEPAGGIVLDDALAYLVVKYDGEIEGGDHVIVLGTVVDGGLVNAEGQPYVHIRQNGLNY